MEKELERLGGTHGLMIVASANQGAITSLSGKLKRCMLYLVGNPVIADKIIAIDIRAEAPANRQGFFCVRSSEPPRKATLSAKKEMAPGGSS